MARDSSLNVQSVYANGNDEFVYHRASLPDGRRLDNKRAPDNPPYQPLPFPRNERADGILIVLGEVAGRAVREEGAEVVDASQT